MLPPGSLKSSHWLLRMMLDLPSRSFSRITVSPSPPGIVIPAWKLLRAATENGLKMFTHVGNGCPMLMHRHDNIINRALSLRDKLWLCFIPMAFTSTFSRSPIISAQQVWKKPSSSPMPSQPHALAQANSRSLAGDILIGEDLVARSPDGSHSSAAPSPCRAFSKTDASTWD